MLNISYPEIQSDTLGEVVEFKLEFLSKLFTIKSMIVDDSGIFIKDLNGFPGVYSSFVYKTIGCDGILKLLNSVRDRTAVFKCCIGFYSPQYKLKFFYGECVGKISKSIRGNAGFGFDPIFIPRKCSKTFAEMSIDEKNSISHRGRAMQKLIEYLSDIKLY
jgi:XTP/dITP diphosphohydrolase